MGDPRGGTARTGGGAPGERPAKSGPSEVLFRQLVAEVRDYAIFLLDLGGRVLSWNAGAEEIKGYRADEVIGEHFSRFFPAEEAARGRPVRLLATARAEGRVETPALLERVFDLFAQGDQGLDRAQGGLGIGLTLVRRLVEMHGGTVRATSEGPGLGSELVLRLPVERTAGDAAKLSDDRPASATPPAARRVLVVDDNRDAADSLSALVALWGHDARVAYDGPSALAQASAFRPELVLLDIGLPGMDGYAVARHLRSAAALAPMTLIAITGYGQTEDRHRSREAGFDHHLVKPIDPGWLRELLAAPPAPQAPPPAAAAAPAPGS